MSTPLHDTSATPRNEAELAEGRSRAFAVLAHLLVRGMDPPLLERVAATPGLAEMLPRSADADDLAADHHALLHMEIYPYAGVFLEPEVSIGSRSAADLEQAYRAAGFCPVLTETSADHLGIVLAFAAFMTGAEADARRDGLDEDADRIRGMLEAILDAHVLTWLPPLWATIADRPPTFWTELLQLTIRMLFDLRDPTSVPPPFELPTPADLLADPRTDLKAIATLLATPVHAGILATRDDITHLGRGDALPRGFGNRRQMLANLLQSAATYDAFVPTLRRLQQLVATRCEHLAKLYEHPPAAPFVDPWIQRARQTATLLERLAESSTDRLAT